MSCLNQQAPGFSAQKSSNCCASLPAGGGWSFVAESWPAGASVPPPVSACGAVSVVPAPLLASGVGVACAVPASGRLRGRGRGGGGRLGGERLTRARNRQVDRFPGSGLVGDLRAAAGGQGERERDERYGDEPLVREAQGATSSQLGSAAIRRPHVGQSLRSFWAG